jgi:1-acyl-sn-glycerol-3-phosphate acyltransferase
MAVLRSLIYATVFYTSTVLWVLFGLLASVFGRAATLATVTSWAGFHHWLVKRVLGIRVKVVGNIPPGAHLVAVKHQSMLETLEMVQVAHSPVIVLKKELADIPFFGWMTRRYGIIAVERSAGARALRTLVQEGERAKASGRSVIIYPEGTRVRIGETPPLKSGFTALYRALGLPVVPVAVDSGRLWGRGLVHRSGTTTLNIGDAIPAGLKRGEIEARVHAAINALESAPQPRP